MGRPAAYRVGAPGAELLEDLRFMGRDRCDRIGLAHQAAFEPDPRLRIPLVECASLQPEQPQLAFSEYGLGVVDHPGAGREPTDDRKGFLHVVGPADENNVIEVAPLFEEILEVQSPPIGTRYDLDSTLLKVPCRGFQPFRIEQREERDRPPELLERHHHRIGSGIARAKSRIRYTVVDEEKPAAVTLVPRPP